MKTRFYLILALVFVVLNIGSGSWGLTESSEARYAEIGREMAVSGDYLHPDLLGIQHYHKPPVTYYITAFGYKIFGYTEFAARFFLSIALVLQIFFVFKIGLLLFKDEKTAFASALIYFTFPVVLIASRNLTTDAYLTTFIIMSIYFWLKRKEGGSVFWLYAFYAILGVAFLTKGPVVLLPGIVFILCWKIIYKEKIKISIHTVLGTLLLLAISASWFIAIIVDIPDLWNYFIEDQIVKRSVAAEKFHRAEPFWYYFLLAPVIGFPWLIFVIRGLIKKYKTVVKPNPVAAILVFTSGIILLLFSAFSSKLIMYILPMYCFVALLAGHMLYTFSEKTLKVFLSIYTALYALLLAGLLFSRFFKEIHMDFRFALPLVAVAIASIFFLLRYLPLKIEYRLLYLGFSFSCCLILTYAIFGNNNPDTINSIKEITSFLKKNKPEMKEVMVYDYLLPSASFYLQKKIITIENGNFNTHRETRFEEGIDFKKHLIDVRTEEGIRKFKQLLQQPGNVLIERKKNPVNDSLQYLLKNFKNISEMGKWKIYY